MINFNFCLSNQETVHDFTKKAFTKASTTAKRQYLKDIWKEPVNIVGNKNSKNRVHTIEKFAEKIVELLAYEEEKLTKEDALVFWKEVEPLVLKTIESCEGCMNDKREHEKMKNYVLSLLRYRSSHALRS